jgi:hypothetical protein
MACASRATTDGYFAANISRNRFRRRRNNRKSTDPGEHMGEVVSSDLGGWGRLGVVVFVAWSGVILFVLGSTPVGDGSERMQVGLYFWALPLTVIYASAFAVRWVYRGFRVQRDQKALR